MSLIKKSAYLEVCPHCGVHASIIYSGGSKSAPFATQLRGEMTLLAALTRGLITSEEAKFVSDEIYKKIKTRISFELDYKIDMFFDLKEEVESHRGSPLPHGHPHLN